MNQTGLSRELLKDIVETMTRKGSVKKIVLYGSRARGDHRPNSDIDLAVDAPLWSGQDLAVVKSNLDEDVKTLLKFDLVLLPLIEKKALVENILKEGIVIYDSATN